MLENTKEANKNMMWYILKLEFIIICTFTRSDGVDLDIVWGALKAYRNVAGKALDVLTKFRIETSGDNVKKQSSDCPTLDILCFHSEVLPQKSAVGQKSRQTFSKWEGGTCPLVHRLLCPCVVVNRLTDYY